MSYGTADEVKARAGRLGDAWQPSSGRRPNEEDLTEFLDQVADEIDGRIAALGHEIPVTDATATAAFRSMNIDGGLVLALEATFPGEMPADVKSMYAGAQKRYERSLKLLDDGKHPALSYLEATTAGAAGASSLWSEEPDYGEVEPRTSDRNVNLRPGFFRGQPL